MIIGSNETRTAMVVVLGFLSGLVLGAVAGLLLAPHSGERTQGRLSDLAGEAGEHMGRLASDVKETVHDLAEKGKRLAG